MSHGEEEKERSGESGGIRRGGKEREGGIAKREIERGKEKTRERRISKERERGIE